MKDCGNASHTGGSSADTEGTRMGAAGSAQSSEASATPETVAISVNMRMIVTRGLFKKDL